jgi:[NiFe] hydrogenase assembly HybE family chaperone
MSGFEGSFLGDAGKITPETVMECGICWWIYDPSHGDDVWQIAPGTAFAELPAHWRCPNCDAPQHKFMVLGNSDHHERPKRAAGLEEIDDVRAKLSGAYERVADSMRSLPVYNEHLAVSIVGMRRCAHGLIAVAATPWSMNLLLLPHPGETGREGTTRDLAFPSGSYTFIAGHLEGVGVIESCSLFSPMSEFNDPAVVDSVARHAIEALFSAEPEQPVMQKPLSRREFLRPGAARDDLAGRGA